ncbi:MAG: helix-turn-helix transcriptional regulator [Oscillospiraceae bacterium]
MTIQPDAKQNIAAKLRALRERAGMTQAELGRLVGRAHTTVASWECAQGQPDADTLLRILAFYGVENILEEFGYAQSGAPLSPDERAHVDCLRALSPDARALVTELAQGLSALENGKAVELAVAARGGAASTLSLPLSALGRLPDEGWKGERKR